MTTVTDGMVSAARQQLPGVWNPARVRKALEAAFALLPVATEQVCDIPVIASIRVIVDEEAFHRSAVEAVHKLRAGLPLDGEGKVSLADLEATLPQEDRDALAFPQSYCIQSRVGIDPIEWGKLLADDVMSRFIPTDMVSSIESPSATVRYPKEAAGVAEIAARLGVTKNAVVGWTGRREQNGMPEPAWKLAQGQVYDLDAVVEWYEKWKGETGTIEGNSVGG